MNDYKILAERIYDRMSVRSYSDKAIDFLEDGTDLIKKFGIPSLFKDAECRVRSLKIGAEVKNVRSKYCLGFFSGGFGGSFENVGFTGQLLSLELQALGIGTCWLGLKMPERAFRSVDGLDFVISMAAGYPEREGAVSRIYPNGFARKSADEICLKEKDDLTEAVRLAPSAMNNQPWLVEKNDNSYNFYMSKPGLIGKLFMGNMRRIDMGIAMAHLFVKAKAAGFDTEIKTDGRNLSDATYIATITLK
ncbi:MAG: hypothetical protein LBP79_00075 [Clostridiales bacterium]|jgi:hypothetical protein|nr:hypothetical protein [Clostridiales bacterium]